MSSSFKAPCFGFTKPAYLSSTEASCKKHTNLIVQQKHPYLGNHPSHGNATNHHFLKERNMLVRMLCLPASYESTYCSPPFKVGLLEFKVTSAFLPLLLLLHDLLSPIYPTDSASVSLSVPPVVPPIYPTDSATVSLESLQSSPLYTRQIQPQSP